VSPLRVVGLDGSPLSLADDAVEGLRGSLRGGLLRSGDPGYDASRTLWNAMIDRRPALIARCSGAADVRRAVDFARAHGVLTAVRGGGHNIAGNAVCDGGLVIDLSALRTVRIDPAARRAHVGPGALLGDFDHEAQAFGLATPTGINSTTGVAGLTLGGGFGWFSRKHGMTVDSLLAADVVTADGKLLRASATENPDLFWALRGGGGNFGVVTRFEFQLHELGPQVLAGLVVYPLSQAAEALRRYRDFAKTLGDETSVWAVLRKAPPLPFLPASSHGTEIVAFAVFHAGDPAKGEKILDPVRRFGTPLGEHVGLQPYVAWQRAFDPLLSHGARNYWKSHNFLTLSDEFIDVAVGYAGRLPSPHCEIIVGQLGGAINRVPRDATAYPHRDAAFVVNVHGRWETPAEDQAGTGWARDFFRASAPYATGGVYVNFMTAEETDRVRAAYGPAWDRLVAAKKTYDPTNLFRLNQNIRG
jgi:FAD/FMN-containing dehydrogenase